MQLVHDLHPKIRNIFKTSCSRFYFDAIDES